MKSKYVKILFLLASTLILFAKKYYALMIGLILVAMFFKFGFYDKVNSIVSKYYKANTELRDELNARNKFLKKNIRRGEI